MLNYRLNIPVNDIALTPEPKLPKIMPEPDLPPVEETHPDPEPSKKRKQAEIEDQVISIDGERLLKKRRVITREVRELLRLEALGDKLKAQALECNLLYSIKAVNNKC